MSYTKANKLIPGTIYYAGTGEKNTWCYLGRNSHRNFVWVRVTKSLLAHPTFECLKQVIEKYGRSAISIEPAPLRVKAVQQDSEKYYAPQVAEKLSKITITFPRNIMKFLDDLSFWYYTALDAEKDVSKLQTVTAEQFVSGKLYLMKEDYIATYIYLGRNVENNCVWFRLPSVRECKQFIDNPTGAYVGRCLHDNVLAVLAVTPTYINAYELPLQTAELRGLTQLLERPLKLPACTPEYLQGFCNTAIGSKFVQTDLTYKQITLIKDTLQNVYYDKQLRDTCKQTAYATYVYTRAACFEYVNRMLSILHVTVPLTVGNNFVYDEFASNLGNCVYTCTDGLNFIRSVRKKLRISIANGQNEADVTYAVHCYGVVHVYKAVELLNVLEQVGVDITFYMNMQVMRPSCLTTYFCSALVYPIMTYKCTDDIQYDFDAETNTVNE